MAKKTILLPDDLNSTDLSGGEVPIYDPAAGRWVPEIPSFDPPDLSGYATQEDLNEVAGSIPETPTWSNISGKPSVVAEGETEADARSAIGAGTSNLALGTTETAAKAGDWTPEISDVSGLGGELASRPTSTTVVAIEAVTELPEPGPETDGRIFLLYGE